MYGKLSGQLHGYIHVACDSGSQKWRAAKTAYKGMQSKEVAGF